MMCFLCKLYDPIMVKVLNSIVLDTNMSFSPSGFPVSVFLYQ